MYSTSSRSRDPAVEAAWGFIESTEARFVPSERPFMIGLDEVGKEVVDPITFVGALVPSGLVPRIVDIVGLAETKTKHPLPYWEDISVKLVALMREGLDLRVGMIPPSISDIYNINHLLDVTYQQMLNDFFRNVAPAKCRVVVDDYRNRVGDTLHRFRVIESGRSKALGIGSSHAPQSSRHPSNVRVALDYSYRRSHIASWGRRRDTRSITGGGEHTRPSSPCLHRS